MAYAKLVSLNLGQCENALFATANLSLMFIIKWIRINPYAINLFTFKGLTVSQTSKLSNGEILQINIL